MTSYAGRHAELYDLFYRDKDYAAEAAFVRECLSRDADQPGRRVLDLACGTGRHAFELERLGFDVVGIDHSESMLAVARRNAAAGGSSVQFRCQDLRALDQGGERFDGALCLFDSIGYLRDNSSVAAALRGIHRHLRPGGLFVFEFWHAAAMLRRCEPLRVRRFTAAEGEVLRLSETVLDIPRQLGTVTYSVYELRSDGRWSAFQETQVNRFFLVEEMAVFLSSAGFSPLHWYAGFAFDQPITEDTWHIVAAARRRPEELKG